jgi:hypothetical protein
MGTSVLPSVMRGKHRFHAAGIAISAVLLLGLTDVLPERVAEVSRQVEEVRGRKFLRAVPASELDPAEAKKILREKIVEGLPAPPEEAFRSIAALGLIDETPRLLDILVDFYASQVIAFYDPQPRRFFVVRGAEGLEEGGDDTRGITQGLIFSHELTHALQDESLQLDRRVQELKDDSDRSLALQCLLEGEATLVMIRVAMKDIPGADATAEEALGPLLAAGALERSNVPKNVPDYFVDQLFFPYVEGTAYVRAAVQKGGWAEVDRLWKHPPDSSAEILHGGGQPPPVQGLLPANVATFSPGRRMLYTDTLGEWTLRFLLRRGLSEDEAARAAAGWRGDRIAYFTAGRSMGYLWRIRFDQPASASRFEAALKKARAAHPIPAPETLVVRGSDVIVASGFAKVPEL